MSRLHYISFRAHWFFFIAVLCSMIAHADEEKSVTERLRFLEDQKGYQFKKRKYEWVVEGEFLYWLADIDGVAYATTSIAEAGGIGTNVKTRTPQFSYDPGFRLSLGIRSPFDLFDAMLSWTRFYTEGHDSVHGSLVPGGAAAPGDKVIVDTIGLIEPLVSIPNRAKANCQIKSNVLDLQLGRGVAVTRYFFLRPYFGVRGAQLITHWHIDLDRNFILPDAFNQDATQLRVINDFRAVGGLIGLEVDWKFSKGLGINARAEGALIYGRTSESTEQKYIFIPAGTSTEVKEEFKAKNSFYSVKAMLDFFAGAYWQIKFYKEQPQSKWHLKRKKRIEDASLRIFAGYEFQLWPMIGQKTITQSTRYRERYNVGFEGLSTGVKFAF
jgi:hypothetical protein